MDEQLVGDESAVAPGLGEQLRAARKDRGLSLEQVAAETRIPQRQLLAIESGDFAALPGRTYAVGFARTYARAVGLDPEAAATAVRADLDSGLSDNRRPVGFEPGDPARVPSRMLAWLSVLSVLVVLAGLFAFFRPYFTPAAQLPSLMEQQQAEQVAAARAGAAAAAPVAPSGAVTFTSEGDAVWVKFYDGAGVQLMQKEMTRGETFTIPAEAKNPQIWTAHPELLAITVGGRPVAKLSETQRTIKDVPVTAQVLVQRPAASPSPAAGAPTPRPAG